MATYDDDDQSHQMATIMIMMMIKNQSHQMATNMMMIKNQNHQMASFWALLNIPHRNLLSGAASVILHLHNDNDDETDGKNVFHTHDDDNDDVIDDEDGHVNDDDDNDDENSLPA